MDRVFARASSDNAFAALYQAFGRRKYAMTGHSYIGREQDLNGWLDRELSGQDLAKWRGALNAAGY